MYCHGRQVGIGAIDHQVGEVGVLGVLGLQVVEFEIVAAALSSEGFERHRWFVSCDFVVGR